MLEHERNLLCDAGTPVAPGVMVATALVVVARGRTTGSGTGLDQARKANEARLRRIEEDFILVMVTLGIGSPAEGSSRLGVLHPFLYL